MPNSKRVDAGRKAKLDGHIMEKSLAEIRTEETGMQYYTDGAQNTKVDIYAGNRENPIAAESQKSPSGNHTQVALYPVANWCAFHGHDTEWYYEFFGQPGTGKAGRKNRSQISESLNQEALDLLNKMEWFDSVVVTGIYNVNGIPTAGTAIDKVTWFDKLNNKIVSSRTVEELRKNIHGGKWMFSTHRGDENATVLWFVDKNGKKLYHLQMKGSGSSPNSMQFHIYKQ
jgi:hypothetical protein